MAYLLDTNVISEVGRRRPDARVIRWLDTTPPASLHLSVIVIGEIRRGVEKLQRRGDAERADRIDQWLRDLQRGFADRIAPVTTEIAREWGRLTARHDLPFVDGLLVATAAVHKWTLVTRNIADVARADITVLNPFHDR